MNESNNKKKKKAPKKDIILTGDRPTGPLHLGHYVGTLQERIRLQEEYESFFIIADLHMLTTSSERKNIEQIPDLARDLVLDSLAAGIEPDRATFYLQSAVPEVYELYTLLQNLVSVARLERMPTLKEMARNARMDMTYGLLGYPVLQTADIIGVRSNLVPVGEDNRSHVEIAREITRRFNSRYGDFFPAPEARISRSETLVGLYGDQKMSKSADNAIFLQDDAETVEEKVMQMKTDEKRVSPDIPGRVEGNPVFIYHDIFNDDEEEVTDLKERYRTGNVGDVEVKKKLAGAINRRLEPMRRRRLKFAGSGRVEELIRRGTARTRERVQETLEGMKEMMGLNDAHRQLLD